MAICPCCSYKMVRHVRNHQSHWFCRHCWQEMPLLEPERLGLVSVHEFFTRVVDHQKQELVEV